MVYFRHSRKTKRRRTQHKRRKVCKKGGRRRTRLRRTKRGGLRVGDRVKLTARGVEHYKAEMREWAEFFVEPDWHRDVFLPRLPELDVAIQDWKGVIRQSDTLRYEGRQQVVEWVPEGIWVSPLLCPPATDCVAEIVFPPSIIEPELEGGATTLVYTALLEGVKNPKSARKIPGTASTLSRRLRRRRAIPPHVSEAAAAVVRATGLQAGGLRRRKTKRRRKN